MTNQFQFKTKKDNKLYIFLVSDKPSVLEGLSEEEAQELSSVDAKQKVVCDYLKADEKRVTEFQKLFDERPLDAFEVFFQKISKQ